MARSRNKFNLIEFLSEDENCGNGDDPERAPSLSELSKQTGVSISTLREQLEVAKVLGFVEVRPRTGIRRQPYTFAPAVRESLSYAIARDRANFDAFADLRNHVEACYWHSAVRLLTDRDKQVLQKLVASAWAKLEGEPIQLPHREHRELHLLIFRRLENPFVLGLMEAYWDAYEEVGYSRYHGLEYLRKVWEYHQRMVEAICADDYDTSYTELLQHMDLIHLIPRFEDRND
ncbi:MAG: FadR family transcriptional regulator [Anaerolineales bacterium]|nr:FadR family transcriptional regulator [Anaerolineales bacterium]